MYSFIIDPINNNNIKINSQRGKTIIKKYLIHLLGGSDLEDNLNFARRRFRLGNQYMKEEESEIRLERIRNKSREMDIERYIMDSDLSFKNWAENIHPEALFEIIELSILKAYDNGSLITNRCKGKGEELIKKYGKVALDILRTDRELTTAIDSRDIAALSRAIEKARAAEAAAVAAEAEAKAAAAADEDEVIEFFTQKIDNADMVLEQLIKEEEDNQESEVDRDDAFNDDMDVEAHDE